MLHSLSWMKELFIVGFCLTFTRGLDDAELFRRFGGDPSQARRLLFSYPISLEWMTAREELYRLHAYYFRQPMTDASNREYASACKRLEDIIAQEEQRASIEERFDRPILQIRHCGDWSVAIEQGTLQGTRPQVLRAVSEGTIAVSIYYDLKCNTNFNYAEHGALVVSFRLSPFSLRKGDKGFARAKKLFRQAGIDPTNHESYTDTLFALAEASGVQLRLDQGAQAAIVEKPLLTGEITLLPDLP